MKLSNAMEPAVRQHLNLCQARSPSGDESCWCPLCRADITALALSALPPRYVTQRLSNVEIDAQAAATVHDEIMRARRQVERFPKHGKGAAVAAGTPVWVVNFPLEEGFRVVEGILHRHEGACDCWNCRCDAVAFALNRYPARYGVEHEGRSHLLEQAREQLREELAVFLDLAVRVVTTAPRHDFGVAAV